MDAEKAIEAAEMYMRGAKPLPRALIQTAIDNERYGCCPTMTHFVRWIPRFERDVSTKEGDDPGSTCREPDDFDAQCADRNDLVSNPPEETAQILAALLNHLRAGFRGLCGYAAMRGCRRQVDHYLSVENHRGQTYNWTTTGLLREY
jgi:hypothetical protein